MSDSNRTSLPLFPEDPGWRARIDAAEQIPRLSLPNRFFGVQEWASHFPKALEGIPLEAIYSFPWGPGALRRPCPFMPGKTVADTHVAFLGMPFWQMKPLTVREWKWMRPTRFSRRVAFRGFDGVYQSTCALRWYLVPPLSTLPTTKGTYSGKAAEVPDGYEILSSVEIVTYHMMAYYLGINDGQIVLLSKDPTRTGSLHLYVWRTPNGKLDVHPVSDHHPTAWPLGVTLSESAT